MTTAVRVVVGIAGALLALVGFASIPFVGVYGLWFVLMGGVAVLAVLLERGRYRSQAAERTASAPGPGGGETERLEPRFRPTAEVFVDPTSGHRMRVYTDATTGERRYVAEAER